MKVMNETADKPVEPGSGGAAGGDEGQIAWFKKQLGEQANEIGKLRTALEARIDEQEAAMLSESFDSDQIAAMERIVERKLGPVKSAVQSSSAQAAEQKLVSKHPDYQQVVQDAAFQAWVKESRVNTAAYEAAIAGDIDTGIALLDQFKSANGAPKKQALSAALTSSRGSSGDSGIREGGVLSREEIRHLKMNDKPRYRAMLPEIMRAYQEGRVR